MLEITQPEAALSHMSLYISDGFARDSLSTLNVYFRSTIAKIPVHVADMIVGGKIFLSPR